ncbi:MULTISPECIES: pyridoxamine 5'-phosphate oxidase family protein [unclassified Streptomyces]|uniref:pyridoxamine 5'-phosphate oxidase family protein n=1 Tax=unclassified Streptomyces TaxID=2593676 RepID=UPI001F0368B0|nr:MULTISPECIES: pyridoxamine 5'-phosphate oxidase family protein [unclassified Streptomyces]MCH0563080.1 pyridoxamine 5'-phosphate oxidase family protein [Streptomyces sp. MUM 2J]MCH0570290.1 pyridoxamine 5'-phosphate oxidase family protein [Streptomyces sp. MUM 136J]
MPTQQQRALDLLARVTHGRVATSMHALPVLACARHIVADGAVLLRMHRGHGYQHACAGHVVAYGADNLGSGEPGRPGTCEGEWSVQVVGGCTATEPTEAQLARFGPAPRTMDGEPFDPVYLRITPEIATVHSADDSLRRHFEHVL